ncbi:unnamed protein product [Microthlaspi erraticum]|uniref:NB-ARC domain-containing protein n=1 Tax=Microthlaspi erraticum TaxID=1685480 RepID=A0A6D2KYR2_9BRAS|nr:unnamed protein product [Microthlaspi erraticum]
MSDCYDNVSRIIPCNDKIIELFTDDHFQEIPVEKFDLNNQDAEICLRRKRVLLVLDDVRNVQDMESFLCGFKRFGPGSLLIITSRERKVLEECQVNEIYELKGLSKEDSMKLFTRCLFGKDVIDEKLRKASARAIERFHGNPSALRLFAEKIKIKRTRRMELALGRICHDPFIYTNMNILFLCFQGTTNSCFQKTFKQSFLFTTSHYQTDFEKLQRFDLANRFLVFTFSDLKAPYLYHDSVKQRFFCATSHNYLFDLKDLWRLSFPSRALESLPIDLRILHLGKKYVLVCQLNKPWEGYKSFSILMIIKLHHSKKLVKVKEISKAHDIKRIDLQDCTSTPITDQLEPLKVLNLSGCNESQTLQTETLCLLCNSATKTNSHLYFDCTFCLSIWTEISNRIHISPLQIWEDVMVNFKESKAKKILSRMVWCSTICGLLAERNRRLYRQSYRSVDAIMVQIDRNLRSMVSRLRKKHPRIASIILQLWHGTS